jgi:hypothetical protein
LPHVLLVAAIFTAYFGSMTLLMTYMAAQVRHRDEDERDDSRLDEAAGDPVQDGPDALLAAA